MGEMPHGLSQQCPFLIVPTAAPSRGLPRAQPGDGRRLGWENCSGQTPQIQIGFSWKGAWAGRVCPLTRGSRCRDTWPFSRFLGPLSGRSHRMSQCLPAVPHCHQGPVLKTPVSRYQVGDRYLRGDGGLNRSASPIVHIGVGAGSGALRTKLCGAGQGLSTLSREEPQIGDKREGCHLQLHPPFFCLPSFA